MNKPPTVPGNASLRLQPGSAVDTAFEPFPYLPDEVLTAEDWSQAELSYRRLRSVTAGDPTSVDYGTPFAQLDMLAHENAAHRLGVYGLEVARVDNALPGIVAAASTRGLIAETPLEHAPQLSAEAGCQVYLKREDRQYTASFKARGALYRMQTLSEDEKSRGVIAVSAGNHAQGVARAGQILGINSLIVMPRNAEDVKVEAVRSYGAEVVLFGDSYSEAHEHSQAIAADSKRVFIHPFDDPAVIAGSDSLGLEMYRQLPTATHYFAAVGGGGHLAGIARSIKAVSSATVIGVEPEGSTAMAAALQAGRPVRLEEPPSRFSDGTAVSQVGELTYRLVSQFADRLISVSKRENVQAMQAFIAETHAIIEPAGALSIAGLRQLARQGYFSPRDVAVAVCSGANISLAKLSHTLEIANAYNAKEALFQVSIPERPGSLGGFCQKVVGRHAITEFRYRRQDEQSARVLVGFAMDHAADRTDFGERMDLAGYRYSDISEEEHFVNGSRDYFGGIGKVEAQEQFFEVKLPERSRALVDFLGALENRWDISFFHYRSYGGETGSVQIAFCSDVEQPVADALSNAGYEFTPLNTLIHRHFG